MGCCETQDLKFDKQPLIPSIQIAIRQDSYTRLAYLLKTKSDGSVDINESRILRGDDMLLTIPTFAITCGSLTVFQSLYKNCEISIEKINEIFGKYNTTATSILCLNGFNEFLQFYLPLALEFDKSDDKESIINTLNLSETKEIVANHSYSAVQIACIKGHVSCVSTIVNYFKNKNPPWWLDVNHVDQVYGENCALLACKSGSYLMIKYLFKNTNANFHILNTSHENALQIFLSFGKRQDAEEQLTTVRFLVEEVGIDIRYEAEETLLICEKYECACYIEERLRAFNIFLNKSELEQAGEIEETGGSRPIKIDIHNSYGSSIRGQDHSFNMNFSNVSKFIE